MNYLVVGGEFNNKGAEAMSLLALFNIMKYDHDSEIYFLKYNYPIPFSLVEGVKLFNCPMSLFSLLNGNRISNKKLLKEIINCFVPGKQSVFQIKKHANEVLSSINVMIDISGYLLGSNWGTSIANYYCDRIDIVKKNGGKVYLMPQSFGPFDFDTSTLDRIRSSLSKCDMIFAREKKGYKDLTSLGLFNVKLMHDSVLIDTDEAYKAVIKDYINYIEDIVVTNNKNIAIIPNYRLIDKGGYSLKKIIDLYCSIIIKYIEFDFYLVAHSGEDVAICKTIKDNFPNESRVHFIDHVLLSFNYQNFIKKMNFIIASRYHAIIHGYKECTPAIIIGWSNKYEDIAELFEQSQYIFDFKDNDSVFTQVDNMLNNCLKERTIIKKHLDEVQNENCYEILR